MTYIPHPGERVYYLGNDMHTTDSTAGILLVNELDLGDVPLPHVLVQDDHQSLPWAIDASEVKDAGLLRAVDGFAIVKVIKPVPISLRDAHEVWKLCGATQFGWTLLTDPHTDKKLVLAPPHPDGRGRTFNIQDSSANQMRLIAQEQIFLEEEEGDTCSYRDLSECQAKLSRVRKGSKHWDDLNLAYSRLQDLIQTRRQQK